MFAHAAQETGQIPPRSTGVEPWQASLYYVREQTCYPATCVKYDTGKERLAHRPMRTSTVAA